MVDPHSHPSINPAMVMPHVCPGVALLPANTAPVQWKKNWRWGEFIKIKIYDQTGIHRYGKMTELSFGFFLFNTFVCLSSTHYLGGFDEKIAKRCQGVAFIAAPWESDNFTPPTSVLAILFISPCFVILHSLRTPSRKVLTTWHFYFSIIHNICNQNVCRLCDALWRWRGRSKKKTKRQSLQRY